MRSSPNGNNATLFAHLSKDSFQHSLLFSGMHYFVLGSFLLVCPLNGYYRWVQRAFLTSELCCVASGGSWSRGLEQLPFRAEKRCWLTYKSWWRRGKWACRLSVCPI